MVVLIGVFDLYELIETPLESIKAWDTRTYIPGSINIFLHDIWIWKGIDTFIFNSYIKIYS